MICLPDVLKGIHRSIWNLVAVGVRIYFSTAKLRAFSSRSCGYSSSQYETLLLSKSVSTSPPSHEPVTDLLESWGTGHCNRGRRTCQHLYILPHLPARVFAGSYGGFIDAIWNLAAVRVRVYFSAATNCCLPEWLQGLRGVFIVAIGVCFCFSDTTRLLESCRRWALQSGTRRHRNLFLLLQSLICLPKRENRTPC
jgi:hypothetical protein